MLGLEDYISPELLFIPYSRAGIFIFGRKIEKGGSSVTSQSLRVTHLQVKTPLDR